MKVDPLISVILPIYKVENYLHKCIDSVLAQTYKNLEIFLVDDGSPDSCGAICDEYAKNDARIKVIHKENGGLSDARNVALDVATGDFIVCVDSDDYIATNHIESLMALITENDADVAINGFCSFYEGATPAPKYSEKVYVYSGEESVEMMFYQEHFDNSAWGKMYRTSLFNGVRYPVGLVYEDLPTTYKLLIKAKKVAFKNDETYYYLLRNGSLDSGIINAKKVKSAITLLEDMDSNEKAFKNIRKSYECRKFSFLSHIYLHMANDDPSTLFFEKQIKQYRLGVLLNGKARKKARVAALLSYFGLKTMRCIFNISTNR